MSVSFSKYPLAALPLPLLLGFIFVMQGCLAGGVAHRHEPSDNRIRGNKYVVYLFLSAPGGNAMKGYGKARIILDGHSYDMNRVENMESHVKYEFEIEYSSVKGKRISYYFIYEYLYKGDMREWKYVPENPGGVIE